MIAKRVSARVPTPAVPPTAEVRLQANATIPAGPPPPSLARLLQRSVGRLPQDTRRGRMHPRDMRVHDGDRGLGNANGLAYSRCKIVVRERDVVPKVAANRQVTDQGHS
jgi:hypothetical protein